MKSLTHYIQEKLVIKKNKSTNYKYFPKSKKELKEIIKKRIEYEGNEVDLNDIDTSNITDMSGLFKCRLVFFFYFTMRKYKISIFYIRNIPIRYILIK